jgi:hypothetical protein
MRCDYSLQLSRTCQSLNKTATLGFAIGAGIIATCPVCANILEEKLKHDGVPYDRVPIDEKGQVKSNAVSTARP